MVNKKYIILLSGGVICLLLISVAYAAMSSQLTLSVNKVTQTAQSWNVALTTGTLTATVEGTGDTGRSCGTATATATAITVNNTTLSKPGDGCVYTFVVNNTGTIAAKLGTITPTKPTSTTCGTASGGNMVCGNITYRVTTNSAGTTIAKSSNTSVAAGGTKTLYLVVRYTGTDLATSAVTQSGAKFTLPFNQA